jgi:hypothetical protein
MMSCDWIAAVLYRSPTSTPRVKAITETPPDIVFHLAGVLSGQSEADLHSA